MIDKILWWKWQWRIIIIFIVISITKAIIMRFNIVFISILVFHMYYIHTCDMYAFIHSYKFISMFVSILLQIYSHIIYKYYNDHYFGAFVAHNTQSSCTCGLRHVIPIVNVIFLLQWLCCFCDILKKKKGKILCSVYNSNCGSRMDYNQLQYILEA